VGRADAQPPPVAASDADTVAYFDAYVPEYDPGRLELAADYIRRHASADSELIDLGCGVGNTLAFLAEQTPITRFAALDVSQNCLDKTRELVECETVLGSAVDASVAARLAGRFDFAILSAVLHHLVGRTRAESRRNAVDAVRNALTMLTDEGSLVIHEPVFEQKLAMDAVFWAKRGLSRVSGNRRVPVLGYWGNLGAPVVSYYSDAGLARIIAEGGGRIVEQHSEPEKLPGLMDRLLDRASTTVAVVAA
jgi:SAM-dependent methyltransferase